VDARWAAVVVNYEAGDALTACVASLLADTSAGAVELVVVDNGSSDGSVRRLRAAFPDVRVVEAGGNVGYATAANRGIAATTAPVVAVCNPDLEVLPGTAAAMLGALADPAVGAVGPRVRNPDGSTYPSARRDPSPVDAAGHAALGLVLPANPFTRRYRALDADPDAARDVDWASGAALWLRRGAVEAIGGWDEGFFMYLEDVDLGRRLRDAGWRVRYEPAGEVVHVQGLSTDRRATRMIVEHHRSSYRYAAKHWRGARRLLLLPAAVLLAVRAVCTVAVRMLTSRSGARQSAPEATR
jgi:N-acetylglucosaminyl-diphospho-decaprenol L-rhamnosyltransferase